MYQIGGRNYAFSSTTKTQSADLLSGLVMLGCLSLRSCSATSALTPGHIKAESFALFSAGKDGAGKNGNTFLYDVEVYSLELHRHLRTERG